MRKLLVVLLTFVSFLNLSFAKKEITGSMNIASDYIWRGLSLSNDKPAVQGSLNREVKPMWNVGIVATNYLASGGSELDLIVSREKKLNDSWTVTGEIIYLQFFKDTKQNSLDLSGIFSHKNNYSILVSFIPNYFGTDSSTTFIGAQKQIKFDENKNYGFELGLNSFSDDVKAGSENYLNAKFYFEILKDDMAMRISYSDTNRNLPVGGDDITDQVILSELNIQF